MNDRYEFDGVEIDRSIWGAKKAQKYAEDGEWILATFSGELIAKFDSETQLDKWWIAFQKKRGIRASKPFLRKAAKKQSKSPKSNNQSSSITQDTLDTLAKVFLATLFEFHPEYEKSDVPSHFYWMVEHYFSRELVQHLQKRMSQSPPKSIERKSLVAWFYKTKDLKVLNHRPIKDSFADLAAVFQEVPGKGTLSTPTPFTHKAVGGGKEGGRWGA